MEATTTAEAPTVKRGRATKRARRGRGEGAIYERKKDGLFCASVSLGMRPSRKEPGKLVRARRTIYGKTKKDVQDQLARLIVDGPEAIHQADKVTLSAHLERWLREVSDPGVRPNTRRSYHSVVDTHIKPHLGHHALAKLTTSHLQTFLSERRAAGIGSRTLQITLVVMRQALKNAVRLGLVEHNVALDVDNPAHTSRTIEHHNADEVARVLARVVDTDPHFAALYELSYDTGARQGEVFGAQIADFDLRDPKASTWTVRHNLTEVAGDLDLTETPKTAAGQRVIDLSERCARALARHKALHAQRILDERSRAARCDEKGDHEAAKRARENADRLQATGYVFVGAEGCPLRKSNFLRRVHDPLMLAAGVREVTPHGLRHTCATLLLSRGVPPHVVARRLGHRDVATTLRIYAHVLPSQQREAADAMGALIDASTAKASKTP